MKINWKLFLLLVTILSLLWEIAHSLLYVCCILDSTYSYIYGISRSAIIDAFIISIVLFLANLIFKKSHLVLIVSSYLFILYSFLDESISVALGRWAYSESMPILLGVGLTPLIKLAVVFLVSVYILDKFKKLK